MSSLVAQPRWISQVSLCRPPTLVWVETKRIHAGFRRIRPHSRVALRSIFYEVLSRYDPPEMQIPFRWVHKLLVRCYVVAHSISHAPIHVGNLWAEIKVIMHTEMSRWSHVAVTLGSDESEGCSSHVVRLLTRSRQRPDSYRILASRKTPDKVQTMRQYQRIFVEKGLRAAGLM